MGDIARAAVVAAGLGAGLPLTGGWLASVGASHLELLTGPSPARPEEVLTLLVALMGAAVAAWLWLGLLIALLGHLPGTLGARCGLAAERVTPAALRRVAAVLVGASLSGALAPGTATADGPRVRADVPGVRAVAAVPAPSFALTAAPAPSFALTAAPVEVPSPGFAPQGSPSPAVTPVAQTNSPAPGWTPTRPLVRPQPSPGLLTTTPAPDERAGTVVRRGDTLWDVVRHHLGPEATDAEVAAQWPRWHAANRAVIGDDPDLLLPGQVLHAPETAGAVR